MKDEWNRIQVIEFGGPEPEYVGGPDSLVAFINQNIIYPKEAAELGIEGRVLVSFMVEGDGSLSEIQVYRSVHPLLDAELEAVTTQYRTATNVGDITFNFCS